MTSSTISSKKSEISTDTTTTNLEEASQQRDAPYSKMAMAIIEPVSYTHLRAHETLRYLVCRLLLEKKK